MPKKNPRRTDKEWLDLIQECRSSGLSDKCWCQEHHIHTSNFYYQIRRLRQKACEIPEPVHSSFSGKQEVVPLSFEEPAVCPSSVQLKTDTIPDSITVSRLRSPTQQTVRPYFIRYQRCRIYVR